jgi:single-stranded DNA-specific DHH superfamily exonuclease
MAYGDSILEPPRFTYELSRDHLERIKASSRLADLVIVLDLAWKPSHVETLALETGRDVVVIDHHYVALGWGSFKDHITGPLRDRVFYCNPAARGDPEGLWPSASYIVSRVYGVEHDLLVAASIVGDLGDEAVNNRVYRDLVRRAGLDPVKDYWLLREAVMQLHGVEVMGKIEAVAWLPKMLATGNLDPFKAIIGDAYLATLRAQAEAELESLVEEARRRAREAGRGIVYVALEGEGRFFSRLARELAKIYPDKIVVVAYYSRSTGEARVYARTLRGKPALVQAIGLLAGKGYSVGGKSQGSNNVIALETRREELEKALSDMISALSQLA